MLRLYQLISGAPNDGFLLRENALKTLSRLPRVLPGMNSENEF